MRPRTFELSVTAAGTPGSYRVAATSDSQGDGVATVSFDPAAAGLDTVSELLKRPVSLQDLQVLGSRLFDVLFSGTLRNLFYTALGEVLGQEELVLRLILRIDPPELSVLPWETLYLAERDRFLAASPKITLSRYLSIPQPIRSILLPREFRVLLLVPSSSGLDTGGEIRELRRCLDPIARVEIVKPATRQGIRQALRAAAVHLVHFAGHGSFLDEEAVLFLDGANGLPDPTPGAAFAELFRDRPSIRLVVLNSCEGASRSSVQALAGAVPQLLQREIPAVIAMQSAILNSAAEAFTATFYAELIEGQQPGNVEIALSRARGALLQDRFHDSSLVSPLFASPVLYLRSEGGELWQRSATLAAADGIPAPQRTETALAAARVFLGSDLSDMGEYREAALQVCHRLGLVPLTAELSEPRGAGTVDGNLLKLDQADVYVGIFAHRYGRIEPGRDTSVTEFEFDYAGRRGLERLCFLVNEGYPWPPDAIDYEGRPRLQAFKKRVRDSLLVSEFTTVAELTLKLTQALKEWRSRQGGPAPAEPAAPPGPVPAGPPRPGLFVGREGALADFEARLGVGGRPLRPVTVVRGWPGVGKTTLLNALAHDVRVRAAFPDGIFWVPLGDQGSPYSILAAWGQRLGLPVAEPRPSLDELTGQVRTLLAGRRALLMVDDVWQSTAAIPFKQVLGPRCALLLSTRFGDVARELVDEPGEDIYVLPVLTEDEALALLARIAPQVAREHSDEYRGLVSDLEGLPLALRVAGRLLASEADLGIDIRPLIEEIRVSHRLLDAVAPDDRFDPRTGTTPTVSLLLRQSTDRLDPLSRDRFSMLGVFAPKPTSFDLSDLQAVWEVRDPLPTLRRLVDRGLLEPIPAAGRFQMHALLVKHAFSLLEAG
jgi:hypothetical protein